MADNSKQKYTPVSIDEVCDQLGFDAIEVKAEENQATKRNIIRLIKFSDMYLQGAIGKQYPSED